MKPYIGRFAPSPTGALHIGSLFAALISFLEAKSKGGEWHLRVEDADPSRCIKSMIKEIPQTLEAFHLFWDGEIVLQSPQEAVYRSYLDYLQERHLVYPCSYSRKEWERKLRGEKVTLSSKERKTTLRLRTFNRLIKFDDAIMGTYQTNLVEENSDFVLQRADGSFSYQLAVVVDDAQLKVSDVVRGVDLIDSTPRQIYLQEVLELPQVKYMHFPILVNNRGQKWSKQTYAPPLNLSKKRETLLALLSLLKFSQPLPRAATLPELLAWAQQHWSQICLPRQKAVIINPFAI